MDDGDRGSIARLGSNSPRPGLLEGRCAGIRSLRYTRLT